MEYAQRMICKPAVDEGRYRKVWQQHVCAMQNQYAMSP